MSPLAFALAFPSPTLEEQVIILGCIGVALLLLLNVAGQLAAIWNNLRRRPSADQIFATKEELAQISRRFEADLKDMENRIMTSMGENRSHNSKNHAESNAKIDSMAQTITSLSNDMMRAIGRVEGMVMKPEAAA